MSRFVAAALIVTGLALLCAGLVAIGSAWLYVGVGLLLALLGLGGEVQRTGGKS